MAVPAGGDACRMQRGAVRAAGPAGLAVTAPHTAAADAGSPDVVLNTNPVIRFPVQQLAAVVGLRDVGV